MSITAALIVYNEEARIENTLRSVMWCDDIVVLDKKSTDKTQAIIRKYTANIYERSEREFQPDEQQEIVNYVNTEWVILLTASDLIEPELAKQVLTAIGRGDFDYDVIHIPIKRFILGIENKRSPWHGDTFPAIFRKSIYSINMHSVHSASVFNTVKHYKIAPGNHNYLLHLTHENMDIMMERITRYCRCEARVYPANQTLFTAFYDIIKASYHVFIRRKTFLLGHLGLALSMGYISYFMLRYLYIWAERCSNAKALYSTTRENNSEQWNDYKYSNIRRNLGH